MADEAEQLEGTVERVVYRDPQTHFLVARFTTLKGEIVTIVGELDPARLDEGLPVRLNGKWVHDKKWGRQFRVSRARSVPPRNAKGIERYLTSQIGGIGPEFAKRLVAHFGLDTLDILEAQPERAKEVPGIGPGRAEKITAAFAARRERSRQEADEEEAVVFLGGLGIHESTIKRIVKEHGAVGAVEAVRANPYKLTSIWGIGFRTADGIAMQLGLARDAPERLEAGLVHALHVAEEDGHVHVPDVELLATAAELLGVRGELLPPRLGALEASQLVVREVLGTRGACSGLPKLYRDEVAAGHALAAIARAPVRTLAVDVDAAIDAFQQLTGLKLAAQQYEAVRAALRDPCVVITGGPGVGKTTIVKAIVHIARAARRKVGLCAPTGRAAKRLGEATQMPAMTIHRLLEYQPQLGGFSRNAENPLELDVLVVDEASMLDLPLFRQLTDAMRPGQQLVLVGDVDQLPSVGPGAVLADTIASDAATVIRLTEIFRQAAASKIVVSAHRINQGEVPDLESPPAGSGAAEDFYFISREDPIAARQTIVDLVAERIPARFGFATTEIQVLAPMHRGDLGTAALNKALQDRVNPDGGGAAELVRGDRVFRTGDKVMQLKNDYDKGVFNGDIGVIEGIVKDAGILRIDFDGKHVGYERSELDQLVHAYAVSIHKSQGSEYPAVVLPIVTQHFMMLQRSLLYTAVTRGKKLVVLVGARRAVAMAVKNADAKRRYTWLAERVRAELPIAN